MTSSISDEYMNEQRAKTRPYTLMLLKKTAGFDREEVWPVVWEHGRRNFALRADGLVSIVLPVADDGELAGLCVFNVEPDDVARLMDDDPGVRAGIFTHELHPCQGFPGDALRAQPPNPPTRLDAGLDR